jgi:hypothetical protein
VRATLHILRDPWRAYPTWKKAEPYQQLDTIFSGVKDGEKFVPARTRRAA